MKFFQRKKEQAAEVAALFAGLYLLHDMLRHPEGVKAVNDRMDAALDSALENLVGDKP